MLGITPSPPSPPAFVSIPPGLGETPPSKVLKGLLRINVHSSSQAAPGASPVYEGSPTTLKCHTSTNTPQSSTWSDKGSTDGTADSGWETAEMEDTEALEGVADTTYSPAEMGLSGVERTEPAGDAISLGGGAADLRPTPGFGRTPQITPVPATSTDAGFSLDDSVVGLLPPPGFGPSPQPASFPSPVTDTAARFEEDAALILPPPGFGPTQQLPPMLATPTNAAFVSLDDNVVGLIPPPGFGPSPQLMPFLSTPPSASQRMPPLSCHHPDLGLRRSCRRYRRRRRTPVSALMTTSSAFSRRLGSVRRRSRHLYCCRLQTPPSTSQEMLTLFSRHPDLGLRCSCRRRRRPVAIRFFLPCPPRVAMAPFLSHLLRPAAVARLRASDPPRPCDKRKLGAWQPSSSPATSRPLRREASVGHYPSVNANRGASRMVDIDSGRFGFTGDLANLDQRVVTFGRRLGEGGCAIVYKLEVRGEDRRKAVADYTGEVDLVVKVVPEVGVGVPAVLSLAMIFDADTPIVRNFRASWLDIIPGEKRPECGP